MWKAEKDGVYLGSEGTPRIVCYTDGVGPDAELAALVRDALNEKEWRDGGDPRTPPEGTRTLPWPGSLDSAEDEPDPLHPILMVAPGKH